jgi:hypothetical protein
MSSAAAPFSAAEFVKTLSDEQKEAVFYAILDEVMKQNPDEGFMGLGPGEGPITAFLISAPELYALREKYEFPIYTDGTEEEAKCTPRSERDWLTVEEAMEWLDEEDEEPEDESSPPPTGEKVASARRVTVYTAHLPPVSSQ